MPSKIHLRSFSWAQDKFSISLYGKISENPNKSTSTLRKWVPVKILALLLQKENWIAKLNNFAIIPSLAATSPKFAPRLNWIRESKTKPSFYTV